MHARRFLFTAAVLGGMTTPAWATGLFDVSGTGLAVVSLASPEALAAMLGVVSGAGVVLLIQLRRRTS